MPENNIQVFNNDEFGSVRVVTEDDKVLFCAKDIATALGYKDCVNAIKAHCRWVVKRHLPHPQSPSKTIDASFIPEGDVYRLIMTSKLPSAQKFESWVFDDVLPSIRKHGIYATEELTERAINDPDWMINLLTNYKKEREERKRVEAESRQRLAQIDEMRPKVDYCDRILQCPDAIPITVIAKDYGKSAQWLNKRLNEMGIRYKRGKTWVLNQCYADNGYTKTETFPYIDENGESRVNILTKWTQKGRMFLYDMLRTCDILPICETEGGVS